VSTSASDPEGGRGGELVDVAFARDPVEADLIKGLLENAGIPSLLQQARLTSTARSSGSDSRRVASAVGRSGFWSTPSGLSRRDRCWPTR
jgi:hypothetical protein